MDFIYKEKLYIDEKSKNYALCLFWYPLGKYIERYKTIPYELQQYQIIGNLFTVNGIVYMLYNLSKTNIKYVFYIKKQYFSHKTINYDKGNVLPYLLKEKELNLPIKYKNFLDKLDFIDVKEYGPIDIVNETRKKVNLPDPSPIVKNNNFPIKPGWIINRIDPINAWRDLLFKAYKFGNKIDNTFELLNTSVTTQNKIIDYNFSTKIDNYENTLITNNSNPFSYTYHDRIYSPINQIEKYLYKLKQRTRQVSITISRVEDYDMDSPPCMQNIFFLLRKDALFLTAVFRSHDLYKGWPNNLMALQLLQENIAKKIKCGLGEITIFSHSAHIYFDDINRIEKEIKNINFSIELDKHYVLFNKNKEKYIAQIYSSDSFLIDEIISEQKIFLQRRLSKYICSVEHAIYVGRMLEKL